MTFKSLISIVVVVVSKTVLDLVVSEPLASEIVNQIIKPVLDGLLGLSVAGALYGIRRRI